MRTGQSSIFLLRFDVYGGGGKDDGKSGGGGGQVEFGALVTPARALISLSTAALGNITADFAIIAESLRRLCFYLLLYTPSAVCGGTAVFRTVFTTDRNRV